MKDNTLASRIVKVGVVEEHWLVTELDEEDIHRSMYGQEFELRRSNSSRTQSWVAGQFTREALVELRDMLNEVLGWEDGK